MTLELPPGTTAPLVPACGAADETLSSLDPWTRRYVVGVILAGTAAVTCALVLGDFRRPGGLIAFLALSTLTAAIKQPLPLKRGASSVSLSYVVDTAALLALGPHAATLVAAMGGWSQCTFRMRNRNPAHRTLFSMAGLAVTMQVAGHLFTAVRAGDGSVPGDLALPLGVSSVAYFLFNTMSVAIAIALSTRQSLTRVWQDNFLASAPSYFIGAATAAGAKLFYEQPGQYWWLVLVLIPAYLTYRSYVQSIQRIEDEQAEVQRASAIQLATIEALAIAIEAKNRTSPAQVRKMQAYVAGLARAVRMREEDIPGLLTATLLHDIGNLGVPEHILSKPGPLTYEEFQKVQIHPRVGAEILKNIPFPYPVADLIAAHHEHWDGTGYPAGLAGEAIPLGARVLAVVDSYASLSSDRPHRLARPHHEVLATLRRTAGTVLDPSLVEPFIDLLPSLEFQIAGNAAARQPAPHDGMRSGPGRRREANALEDIATAHHEARALYEIAQALGASLDVTETMGLITANLLDLVPYSCSALFLLKEETGRFECRWASGLHDRELRQVVVGSVGELERALPALAGVPGPKLQSALASPLVVSERVIGALAIFHTAADAYLQDHRRVFRRVAEHASLVIHNSIVFERTQEASFTDQLTRLPNRRYMLLYLTQQMARAEQSRSKLAVLMFDMNGFKAINDALGHQAGDRALYQVAAVLRSMVRSYDVCVRYGGDEFVAILWECDAENAEERRLEMERAVAATYFEGRPGETFPLSASAGIAVFPEDGQTHEELIAVADRRMYQRKAKKKDAPTSSAVLPSIT
jgi:diguanylate cyclase (GGDEF)-like protein